MGEGKAVVVMESEKGCRGKCRRTNDAAPTFYWVFLIPAPNFSVEPVSEPSPESGQLQGLEALEGSSEQYRLPSLDLPISSGSISWNRLRIHIVSYSH